jgi:hypothetical protein
MEWLIRGVMAGQGENRLEIGEISAETGTPGS